MRQFNLADAARSGFWRLKVGVLASVIALAGCGASDTAGENQKLPTGPVKLPIQHADSHSIKKGM